MKKAIDSEIPKKIGGKRYEIKNGGQERL